MEILKKYGWKLSRAFMFVFFILLIYLLRLNTTTQNFQVIMLLCSINFAYLSFNLVLALFYTPYLGRARKFKVSVVVPSYNEASDSVVNAIITLLKQTYPIHEIIFIDDGSDSNEAYLAVKKIDTNELSDINKVNKGVKLTSIRLKENSGKKKAQEIGFIQSTGDLFLLVDSDGEITENTLEEMVKPFCDPKVGSVVGRIEVRNLKTNFLTKLQDIIYSNSFQVGRASQSITGSVVVCSGALSMHRASLIKRNMRTFRKEKLALCQLMLVKKI